MSASDTETVYMRHWLLCGQGPIF